MAINDGTTVPVKGFAGTITGLVQSQVEESNGARSITKVKGEKNETLSVLIADPFEEIQISGTVLSTYSQAVTPGSVAAYNEVNYAVQPGATKTLTSKFARLSVTLRKPGSITYSAPA